MMIKELTMKRGQQISMRRSRSNFITKKVRACWFVFLGVFVFMMFVQNLSASIYGNAGDHAFVSPPPEDDKKLEDYVIEGAAYFLDSYSNFLKLLKQAELGKWNPVESEKAVEAAIINMQYAVNEYKVLNQKMESHQYDQKSIDDLKKFDYNTLQKKHRLIGPIFHNVRDYLRDGKIREVYKRMLYDCKDILDALKVMQGKLKQNMFPGKTTMWDFNQSYSQALLFGEYAARVFIEIKKSNEKDKK
jgi:hypothetical protein